MPWSKADATILPRPGVRGWGDFFSGKSMPEALHPPATNAPYMILDDARGSGPAYLLSAPTRILVAKAQDEVKPCLEAVRQALQDGQIVAGFLSYEAGAAFEPRLAARLRLSPQEPLLWFASFASISRATIAGGLLPPPMRPPGELTLAWSALQHGRATEYVLALIRAGDIYQANLTFRASLAMSAEPAAHYAAMRDRQAAGWGGLLFTGQHWLASLSPELFFALDDGLLEGRPMKGTAAREASAGLDRVAIETLRACPKERAENLMIVDLIRNDFSRIAEPGSVRVPELFSVETYPTLHQMTSRVTARLAAGRDAIDVIEACFPCGSVTGAPKLRAMEVIAETETRPRGSYTGSMGIMMPDGSAAFNVMIRTLSCQEGAHEAVLGVGSGITHGSKAGLEWEECLTKLDFAGIIPRQARAASTSASCRNQPSNKSRGAEARASSQPMNTGEVA